MQLLRTYHVHETTLPWASLKIHKGHTKVNVKLVQYFDVKNIPINLQHVKAIYEQLLHSQGSRCHPLPIRLQAQATTIPLQPKGAEGSKGVMFSNIKAFLHVWRTRTDEISSKWRASTNCNEGPKPWIVYDGVELKIILMSPIYGTFRSHHWGWRMLVGHQFCHLLGNQILPTLRMLSKSKSYTKSSPSTYLGLFRSHHWQCRIWGEGHTDFAIFDRGVASILCPYSNRLLPRFCQNLKGET